MWYIQGSEEGENREASWQEAGKHNHWALFKGVVRANNKRGTWWASFGRESMLSEGLRNKGKREFVNPNPKKAFVGEKEEET